MQYSRKGDRKNTSFATSLCSPELICLLIACIVPCASTANAPPSCQQNPLFHHNINLVSEPLVEKFRETLLNGTGNNTISKNYSMCPAYTGRRTCCTEKSFEVLKGFADSVKRGAANVSRLLDLNATQIFKRTQFVLCVAAKKYAKKNLRIPDLYDLTNWTTVEQTVLPKIVQIKEKSDIFLNATRAFDAGLTAYTEGLICLSCDPMYGKFVNSTTVSLDESTCSNLSFFFNKMLERLEDLIHVAIPLTAQGVQVCCEKGAFSFVNGNYCSSIVPELNFMLQRKPILQFFHTSIKSLFCGRSPFGCRHYLCNELLKGLSFTNPFNNTLKWLFNEINSFGNPNITKTCNESVYGPRALFSSAVDGDHEVVPTLLLSDLTEAIKAILRIVVPMEDSDTAIHVRGVNESKQTWHNTYSSSGYSAWNHGCLADICNATCPMVSPDPPKSIFQNWWVVVPATGALALSGLGAVYLTVKMRRAQVYSTRPFIHIQQRDLVLICARNRARTREEMATSTVRAESFLRDELLRLRVSQ